MDLGRPTTTAEEQAFIGMIQYYSNMWPMRSNVLDPLIEAAICPKGISILWNGYTEVSFREINHMASEETVLNYPYLTIPLTVHKYTSDKQLGAVISPNDETIAFFLKIIINPQNNYTTPEKELISIV